MTYRKAPHDVRGATKPPSIKDAITFDQTRGQPRVRWLHPTPTKQQRAILNRWNTLIRACSQAWKYLPWPIRSQYERQGMGTWLQPRDIYVSATLGGLWLITTKDGQTYWPYRAWEKMSTALDIFGTAIGTILRRTANGWAGTAPSAPNQVLISTSTADGLEWRDATGLATPSALFPPANAAITTNYTAASSSSDRTLHHYYAGANTDSRIAYTFSPPPTWTAITIKALVRADPAGTGNIVWQWRVRAYRENAADAIIATIDETRPGPSDTLWRTLTCPSTVAIPNNTISIGVELVRYGSWAQDTYSQGHHIRILWIEAQ